MEESVLFFGKKDWENRFGFSERTGQTTVILHTSNPGGRFGSANTFHFSRGSFLYLYVGSASGIIFTAISRDRRLSPVKMHRLFTVRANGAIKRGNAGSSNDILSPAQQADSSLFAVDGPAISIGCRSTTGRAVEGSFIHCMATDP